MAFKLTFINYDNNDWFQQWWSVDGKIVGENDIHTVSKCYPTSYVLIKKKGVSTVKNGHTLKPNNQI